MQTIWMINQYATCPSRGTACRHFMLARELVKIGYNVTIIAGAGHHFHQIHPTDFGEKNLEIIEGVTFLWLQTPKYKQAKQFTRGIAWIIFFLRLMFVRARFIQHPKIILYSSPSLIPFLAGYFLSWRYQSKLFFEFRDIWPLTFVKIGNYSPFHPIVFLQAWIEKIAIKKSDAYLSTMEFGSLRIEELGGSIDKFYWVPNGVEFREFSNFENKKELIKKTNTDFSQHFIFGYVGTHGQANALGTIIEAAQYLINEPIHIIFVGNGSERKRLMTKTKSLALNNITFIESVSKNNIPHVLQTMNAFLISWHDSEIYKYGTSANKLGEYFAAGKPVVQAYSGEGDNVEKYNAGITVPANDSKALADAMIKIANTDTSIIQKLGKNALLAAHDHFTFDALAKTLSIAIKERG